MSNQKIPVDYEKAPVVVEICLDGGYIEWAIGGYLQKYYYGCYAKHPKEKALRIVNAHFRAIKEAENNEKALLF